MFHGFLNWRNVDQVRFGGYEKIVRAVKKWRGVRATQKNCYTQLQSCIKNKSPPLIIKVNYI